MDEIRPDQTRPDQTDDLQKEKGQRKFIITEVNSSQQLFSLLEKSGAHGETLSDQGVSENLKKLMDRVESAGKKLFLVETNEGKWSVIASSQEELKSIQGEVEQISILQGKIDPQKLWG